MIRVLPPEISERIAAGEVIERPASVVKELVENALDAGATQIQVSLEDGGKALIEVLDNGRGMPPEDLRLSVQRHATSKLQSLDDLEKLVTLGFRGEALPSVAAVSDLSILSRTLELGSASELRVNPDLRASDVEAVTFGHFMGSPHGTRVRAQGLFSRIPARLKFLKSKASEVGAVREWMERLALSHPETGFQLVSDGRTILHLRPDKIENRIRSVLADGEDYPILSAEDMRKYRVRAYWVQGLSVPNTRKLVQIVNGRVLRDRLVQQAILSAFKQSLLPGQFPALVLFLDLDPAEIDVNVHPTKTEVRFLQSSQVFRAVDFLVESLIAKHGALAHVPGLSREDAQLQHWAEAQAAGNSQGAPVALVPGIARGGDGRPFSAPLGLNAGSSQGGNFPSGALPAFEFQRTPQTGFSASDYFHPRTQSGFEFKASHPLADARYVGTLFQTYLLYEAPGGEAWLVDQHAAHERIRYEKLRARVVSGSGGESQDLLIPEVVKLKLEEMSDAEVRLPWLKILGFDAERFGDDSILFRTVPAEWGSSDLKTRLKNLVERMLSVDATPTSESRSELLQDEVIFEKIASEACHSAIRAGDRLHDEEIRGLVAQLFECTHPWNCPHGRPTIARVPRGRFEEWFQRRV